MKKLSLLLLLLVFSMNTFGQASVIIVPTGPEEPPRKVKFGFNKALEGSFGFDHFTSYIGSGTDSYGVTHPVNMFSVDIGLPYAFAGISFGEKETGKNVYGYAETMSSFEWHVGPSFKVSLKAPDTKIVLSPYVGSASYTVNDKSGNAIGQKQDYGERDSEFLIGLRVGFAYRYFIISANASTKDVGVKVGVNLDFD